MRGFFKPAVPLGSFVTWGTVGAAVTGDASGARGHGRIGTAGTANCDDDDNDVVGPIEADGAGHKDAAADDLLCNCGSDRDDCNGDDDGSD